MRSLLTFILSAMLLAWAPLAHADEASKDAKIQEMMRLTHMDQMLTQMLNQMKSNATAQMEKTEIPSEAKAHAQEMQSKMMTLIADKLSWEKAEPAFAKIYADTFTESELDGIVAFYTSPVGQAMIEKTPELMQKSMSVGQQLMGDIMPQIQQMIEQMKQPNNTVPPK
jgi:hypothetical protein